MYSGYAKAPVARMTSTSSMMCSTANRAASSEYQVYEIRTVASSISGGVTSNQTYSRLGAPHRAPSGGITPPPIQPGDPGVCEHCHWELDANGDYYCTECGAYIYGGCSCTDECHCPLPLDWTAILFLLALACAYMVYKETKNKHSV